MTRRSALLSILLATAGAGQAQTQVDLSVLDQHMGGPRTQVLVLGSVHLAQLPDGVAFTHESLQPLLDRPAAYKPDLSPSKPCPAKPAI